MPPRKTKTTKKTVKKDTSWQLTTIPLHSWIIFWALVFATMALVIVCFTTAFRPQTQPEVDEEALTMFQAVRESLEQQVAELEGRVETGAEVKGQVVASEFTIQPQGSACNPLGPGGLPADQTIRFTDAETGITGALPYNLSWGNEKCFVVPYDKTTNLSIDLPVYQFGPVFINDYIAYRRASLLEVLTPTSSAPVLRELQARPKATGEYPIGSISGLKQRIINGMTVISYEAFVGDTLFGNTTYWDAFGRTYRYLITSHSGGLTDAEAVKIIQSLRVTQ